MKQLRDGSRTLLLILRVFLLFKPFRFFGTFGMLMVILGTIYGFIRTFTDRLGFPTLAVLVILLGIQSIFFGLLADQISMARLDNLD